MRPLIAAVLCLIAACTPQSPPTNERAFQDWLDAAPERSPAFARFEEMLRREGVADVVVTRELWLTDRLAPECVVEPFTTPPEALWPNIVPALRFIRDHVEPAIGQVTVASGYRDEAFNTCVGGARRSVHRSFHALDLTPIDRSVSRERLIGVLCPVHVRYGPDAHIGMGIYRARRFHIDSHNYRGWGEDHRGGTFPCATGPR